MATATNWWEDPEELALLERARETDDFDEQEAVETSGLSLKTEASEVSDLSLPAPNWWEDQATLDTLQADREEAGIEQGSIPRIRMDRSLSQELGVGLERGKDQTIGLGYGFVGLLGQAVGLEGVEEYGVENYLRKMEEAALNEASVRDPFEEIDDLGDAGLYAAGIIGEQIPQLLASALGGGIGGLAAKTIGKRIVGNMIGKRVSAGLAGQTFADDAARAVATGNLRAKAAEDVAKETAGTLLANAGRTGGVSGAYLANFGQISGGSFGQMAQELGRGDAAAAVGFAIPGAALDTLGEVFIASKFLKPFSKAQRAAAEGVDTSLSLGRIGGGAATGFAAGSAIEGGTEYVQTGLEQAALGAADPNRTIEDVVMTPEAERERRIAGAAGATVGGPLGGVGGGFEVAFSPRTTQTLNDRARQTQTETGVLPEQEQDQQQEVPTDEEWSEPVKIASRNEEYNGLEYRQNKAGQVWAFNVPEVSRFGSFAIPTKYGQGILLNPAFEGASDVRSEVKAKLAEMADPEAFKAPPVTPPKKVEENLEDADLVDGDETAVDSDAIAAAAERRRQRDQEIVTRDLESAAATLSRPQEDAKGFVDSLKEGDQVSVLTEDGEGNAYSIPMTFVRLNQNGQAQLRSEPDEDNNVVTRIYDADEFNRITTRSAEQVAPAATTGTGIKVSPLTEPIRPAAEGEQLSEADRAQNLLYRKDVEGAKIDDNLWINVARGIGVPITPETTGAVAEQEIRNRFGVERTTTKQDDPASQVLMDALGPNPTKQKLESVTGTRWTGKGGKFTWMMPDNLGGRIPITTRLFNRKKPAETLPIPDRPANRGFLPEEQGRVPAAPDIQTTGPDLVAKSSAEFVGVRDATNDVIVSTRPTRGKDNASYLKQIDTAADTTIRQMNFLGQPVLVTSETAQSLAEANQFWTEFQQQRREGKTATDRQPVRFYTQERSDKDGNRNTFVTGVTYEGRTYRVGKTPDEFNVDRPLTSRGAKSRRRGRGVYDAIRIASPSRRERSEAGMAGRQTEGGPLADALRGVQGRAAIAELNEAENAVYGFFDGKITGPILNIQDPAVTTEVRDTALETARSKVAAAFLKAKKANPSEKTKVLPGRQRTIGEKVAEKLLAYQEAKRGLAIQALRAKFQALRDTATKAKAGARGTGAAKSLKMSPKGAIDLITRARRGQKVGIPEAKRATRDEALTALQELVDFGALDQEKKDAQIKRILDKAEKFSEIDRDFMAEQIISDLAEADKALAAQQGRKYSRSTPEVAQERRLILSTFELLNDSSIRSLNPYNIGNSALSAAKRTATRKGMTRDEVSFDDESQGAGNEAAMQRRPQRQGDDFGQVTQGKLAERGRPMGVENKLGAIASFSDDYEEGLRRFDTLTEADRNILNRLADKEIERGDLRGRQIKGITENERLRAARVVAYLEDDITYEQLYRNRTRRSGEEEYIRRAAQRRATARQSGPQATGAQSVPDRSQSEAELAGVSESRARRSTDPVSAGRSERVTGSPADQAGTVPERTSGQAGGRSVQPTPRRTRTVAAAAQRDFAGALLGLNEAETAALPQGTVDRVYQSYLATLDGVLAEQGNNPLTASAAPAADTVTADGKKMFERFAAARLNPDQQRAAIIRSNMAQAYRAGLFDADPIMSAINKIAADKTQPANLRLMAKEFVKNAKRGVRFDRVVLDIGRFTKPGNTQTTWAGLFSLTPEGAPVVSVNLDNLHDKDSVPLTFLHELQHVVIRDKVRRAIPLTRAEEDALARLEDLRGQAVIAAARQQGIEVGATPDVNALAEQLYALTDPNKMQSGAAVDNRRLAGLVNLEEFVIEMIGNPDMVQLLSELGFGEARTDGKRFTLTGALKNAWNAVVELLAGVKVDPTSPLAMAFKDSWTVNFGTGRSPNITEIKASKRLADRQKARTRQQYIEGEIEARDMAGTSRERNRIMQEIIGPADPQTEAMRASMLEAARGMTEDQWVAAARAQGFNFVDPVATYRSARAEAIQAAAQQATGDTVQVAESRAVRREQESLEAERNALTRDILELEPDVEIAVLLSDPRFIEIARANTTADLKQIRTSLGLQRPAPPTSSAFKGWFKNSKITNRLFGGDNDQPARMFHGSPFNIESVFRSEEEIQREEGLSRWGDEVGDEFGNSGIYFTATPRYASIYTRDNIGGNVTPVYLSIQNPYYVRDEDGWWGATTNYFKALTRWSRSEGESFRESLTEVRAESRSTNLQTRSSAYISNRRLQELREQGYDGIINLDADEVVVFQPTQIKSAITNTGNFSATNPDIRESRARGRVTPQQDTDYLAAVESGDMETAQQLETSAATSAGYMLRGKHGTPRGGFNVFDTRGERIGVDENDRFTPNVSGPDPSAFIGSHFAVGVHADRVSRDFARGLYQGRLVRKGRNEVYDVHLKINNPKFYTAEEFEEAILTQSVISNRYFHDEWFDENAAEYGVGGRDALEMLGTDDGIDILADMYRDYSLRRQREAEDLEVYDLALNEAREIGQDLRMRLEMDGHDGVIYDNLAEGGQAAIVFEPSQIKRAGVTRDDQGNVIPLSQRFNEASPDIRESRARGRVWRERVRVTPTGGTISQGGMFAVDELLDKRAGDAYRSSRMAIKADISVIQELSRLLERQMKSLYKGQTAPLETINTALGNLENPLNSQQLEEIERLFNAKKTKQASNKRDQYIRENRKRFREVTQPAALAQLPEELASTIREMSSHIESLSKRLPTEGLVSGDLAITVEEALGMYLNRSYAIFDDPKWVDRVRKNPKVMDAARKFIRNMLTDDKANNLIDDATTSGRVLSIADAKSMANDSVTDADIEATLEGYLAVGEEAPSVELLSGRVPGQKNLSMLTPRGNIAPEIQALWGRYEDPQVNYAKTVMKLSSVIANNQFLTELRDMGVEEGWLWSSKNNPDDLRHPPGYIKISSEGNPALTPLGGMYAHPMLAEGLFKMFPVGSTDQHYWWLQSAMKLTGISMAVKTVGSVASQIRNYLGNYLNLIATGNLGLGDIASGDFKKRFNNSTDTVLANTFNKYRNATRAEWRAKIDDYIRRGIVGESVTTGLLEDLLTASRKAGSPDFGDVVWNKVSEPFKRVADFAVKTYSSGDDWFKVMIYEAEQDKYRRAHPDWDDNKIKDKAAEISRDIHWTYSLAPSIVQDLKKFPFVAPFVTFTTEVIRTTYNLQKLARQEIMEGRASGNKELEAIGWKRVRGMTTAAFLPAAVGSTTMALAGISGDDEEDLRRFLPDWQKNSALMLFRKENGEVSFVDISFLDPYEYFKKPLTAFMRSLREGDNASEMLLGGTMAMVRQAVDPFTSEQIFAGAIMDVMRNQDAAGRQVYNPQDTGANIGTAVARKIFIDPFTPGTFNSIERIGKAAFGVQSESGRAYGLFNELASVMAGQRVSEMDAQQALQFKGSRFMREMRDASALFNREFVSQGTRSAGDVVSGYERSNGARRALVGSIRKDYLAAIRLGVPVARAKAILRDAGIGRETLRMATTGIYKSFEASEDSLSLVKARGNNDRITAYNQARRAAPDKDVLP